MNPQVGGGDTMTNLQELKDVQKVTELLETLDNESLNLVYGALVMADAMQRADKLEKTNPKRAG